MNGLVAVSYTHLTMRNCLCQGNKSMREMEHMRSIAEKAAVMDECVYILYKVGDCLLYTSEYIREQLYSCVDGDESPLIPGYTEDPYFKKSYGEHWRKNAERYKNWKTKIQKPDVYKRQTDINGNEKRSFKDIVTLLNRPNVIQLSLIHIYRFTWRTNRQQKDYRSPYKSTRNIPNTYG